MAVLKPSPRQLAGQKRRRSSSGAPLDRKKQDTRSETSRSIIRRVRDGTYFRHAEQAEWDKTARDMPKSWLPSHLDGEASGERQNLEPRGIYNPSVHCYQNSVYQSLMHAPIFLNWIRTHVRSASCEGPTSKQRTCVKCNMKRFVEVYWGPKDSKIPIQYEERCLQDIKEAAWNGGFFEPTYHEDASEFFWWLVDQMDDKADQVWHDQWKALFGVSLRQLSTCSVCHTEAMGPDHPPDTALNVGVEAETDTTVEGAIHNLLLKDRQESECHSPECKGVDREKLLRRELRAAPRILRVTLKISFWPPGASSVVKNFHALNVGETLDLTQYQHSGAVPLRYTLSGVISHSGRSMEFGHYVASVRSHSQCPAPFYNISDTNREAINLSQFMANPQDGYFQVYSLTYLRDESYLADLKPLSKSLIVDGPKIDRLPLEDLSDNGKEYSEEGHGKQTVHGHGEVKEKSVGVSEYALKFLKDLDEGVYNGEEKDVGVYGEVDGQEGVDVIQEAGDTDDLFDFITYSDEELYE